MFDAPSITCCGDCAAAEWEQVFVSGMSRTQISVSMSSEPGIWLREAGEQALKPTELGPALKAKAVSSVRWSSSCTTSGDGLRVL